MVPKPGRTGALGHRFRHFYATTRILRVRHNAREGAAYGRSGVRGAAACCGGVAERRRAITNSGAINVSSLKIVEQFFCHNAHTLQPTKRYQILACDPVAFGAAGDFGVSYSLDRVDLAA